MYLSVRVRVRVAVTVSLAEAQEEVSMLSKQQREKKEQHEQTKQLRAEERSRILQAAQATIQTLQQQLKQKSGSVVRMHTRMQQALNRHRQRKEADAKEVERLHVLLRAATSSEQKQVQEALQFLEERPTLPSQVVSVAQMEAVLEEKARSAQALEKQVEILTQRVLQQRARVSAESEHRQKLEAELAAVREKREPSAQLRRGLRVAKAEAKRKEQRLHSLEGVIREMKEELLRARARLAGDPLSDQEAGEAGERGERGDRGAVGVSGEDLEKERQGNRELQIRYERMHIRYQKKARTLSFSLSFSVSIAISL